MRFLPLIVAVILVFGGAGVYAGFRVVEPLGLGRWFRWISWFVLLLPATLPLWFIIDRLEVGRWLNLVLAVCYVALGLASFLFVLALFRDFAWLLLRSGHRVFGVPQHLPDVLHFSSFGVLVLAILLSGIAVNNALSPPSAKRVQIKFDELHPDLESVKIVQLSDLHLGVFRGAGFLAKIVESVNEISPELVVITGDLTDGSLQKLKHTVSPLEDLEAPVFFVTGNHEYYWTPTEWIQFIESLGVRVLLDTFEMIPYGGAKLLLAGVSDPTSQVFIPQEPSGLAALNRRLDVFDADLKILLAHRPGTAYQAAKYGFDLQLSGHTHGGQFFPWNYVIHLVQPFAAGLHRFQDMRIYCSQGTGFWGPPMRLGTSAEITEITLSQR